MLTEQGCADAWSVLNGHPTARAQQTIRTNRRNRWLAMICGIVPFVALGGLWWSTLTDEQLARRSDFLGAGWSLATMGLAVVAMAINLVLMDRSETAAVRGTSPDEALPPSERRALRAAIARVTPTQPWPQHPWWQPVAVNVALRLRREGWSILGAVGSLLLFIGFWLGNPGLDWPLLALAVAFVGPSIALRARKAFVADRFLRNLPDADRPDLIRAAG